MRAQFGDARLGPIVNLHPNPRGVYAAGTRWATNPGTGGVLTKESATDGADPIVRFTWTTANTAGTVGCYLQGLAASNRMPVDYRKPFSASVWVKPSQAITFRPAIEVYGADPAVRTFTYNNAITTLAPAGVWTRLTTARTTPFPADTTLVTPTFYAASTTLMPVGGVIEWKNAMGINEAGAFDYSTPGSAGWKWTGNADLSHSVGWPKVIPTWRNLLSVEQASFESTTAVAAKGWSDYFTTSARDASWGVQGGSSLRINAGTSDVSAVMLGAGQDGTLKGLVPGNTYTLSGTLRLDAPQVNAHPTRARRITAFAKRASDGFYTEMFTAAAPNEAGVHRISSLVTAPADATEFFIRLMNGTTTAAPTTVWWDRVGMYERNEFGDPPSTYWSPGTF